MTFLGCERSAIGQWLLGFVASPFLYSGTIVHLVHCIGRRPVRPTACDRFARNSACHLGAVFIASAVTRSGPAAFLLAMTLLLSRSDLAGRLQGQKCIPTKVLTSVFYSLRSSKVSTRVSSGSCFLADGVSHNFAFP